MSKKVAVIGAGPGGYVAAIRAAQLGNEVTLIERDKIGGVCLNRGCIPTKAMVASVELLRQARRASDFGLEVEVKGADFPGIMARKDAIVRRLQGGIGFLLKKNGITLVNGSAAFVSPRELSVAGDDGSRLAVQADAFIVATGGEAAVPPVFSYDGKSVITSDEALSLTELPGSMVVIGGGVIGCEFASIFAELGVRVRVVELLPGLLPMLEPEIGKMLALSFKKRGIQVATGVKVAGVRRQGGGACVEMEDGASLEADKVLVSIGRRAETTALNLDAAGVEVTRNGRVHVDAHMRTNVPHIYAIGDVNDLRYDLAHVASHHGLIAAENASGGERAMDDRAVPNCVFTCPEIASVGMTEEEAKAAGHQVKTGKFPFLASGKALAMGETEGFVKVLADGSDDSLLGVHVMGPHASDLIAEATAALNAGLTASELAETIHAHPTLAEAMMEAAEAVHGRAIHI